MHEGRKRSGFRFVCDRSWDSLAATADPKIRHCDQCGHAVHDCANDEEAKAIASLGGCVALSAPTRPEVPITVAEPTRPLGPMKTVGMLGDSADGFPVVGWFVIVGGAQVGRVIELAIGTRSIGSGLHANLVIPDPALAPLHADIVGSSLGFSIAARDPADLAVNGKRDGRCDLVDNDVVEMGATSLRFKSIV